MIRNIPDAGSLVEPDAKIPGRISYKKADEYTQLVDVGVFQENKFASDVCPMH